MDERAFHVDVEVRRAHALPAEAFTSEAFLERELATLFAKHWTLLPLRPSHEPRDDPRSLAREKPLKGQRRLPLGVPKNHSRREEYRRCGRATCSTCAEGSGHGPYVYAVWREGKSVRRKYLGRAKPR